jgi:hypothetical protein
MRLLNLKDVKQVYTGKIACMCGCSGSYNEDTNSRSFKIIANKVLKNPNTVYIPEKKFAYLHDDVANRNQTIFFN